MIMEATIGETAGQIWAYLWANGPQSWRQLQRGTCLPERRLALSVGWLAREGKLVFVQDGRALTLCLREE